MLTYRELVALEQRMRGVTVLSVYLNGEGSDSASRGRWRAGLRHALDDIADWLRDSPRAEREAFAALRARAEERAAGFPGEIGSPGWAAFLTQEGVAHESYLPVGVPTVAAWSTGPSVAPYVRAIKEARPVIVAIADSRQVRLHRYVHRGVEVVETLEADVDFELPRHMGRPAPQGFHTGTRGRTGTDAAQDALQQARDELLGRAAERIAALAGEEGWVAIGGIPGVARAALAQLAPTVAERATIAEIDVHATEAQVAGHARAAASRLREEHDLERVREAIDAARANGPGVTGSVDTQRALEEGRARELYFTAQYLADHAADVESAVRTAFDRGTIVEHLSGQAGALLDGVGGIAARLRYVLAREPATAGEER